MVFKGFRQNRNEQTKQSGMGQLVCFEQEANDGINALFD